MAAADSYSSDYFPASYSPDPDLLNIYSLTSHFDTWWREMDCDPNKASRMAFILSTPFLSFRQRIVTVSGAPNILLQSQTGIATSNWHQHLSLSKEHYFVKPGRSQWTRGGVSQTKWRRQSVAVNAQGCTQLRYYRSFSKYAGPLFIATAIFAIFARLSIICAYCLFLEINVQSLLLSHPYFIWF